MVQATMGILYCYSALSKITLQPQTRRLTTINLSRWLSSKELMQPSIPNSQDFLLQNIKSSTDTENVLQIVGTHHTIMNTRHVMLALKSLFDLKKSGNCRLSNQEMVKSPNFIKLCKRLKSQARGITLNDTVQALKFVSFIGVPSSSTIVQVLLQLIRQNVNDLSLEHIIFIEFIMRNFDRSPLVDALRIALPLVFEAQLNVKINRDDVKNLAEVLHYASKKSLSEYSVNLIVDCLEVLIEDIDVITARTIVSSLYGLKNPSQHHQTLLRHCWNILARNIDQCSSVFVVEPLDMIVKKCSWNQKHFYHEGFADSCAKYVVEKDKGFDMATLILRKLTKLAHVNINLIDYIGEQIVNDPKLLEECGASSFISVISGMANAEYKPAGWECIRQTLLRNRILNEKTKLELPWIRMALNLATLDIFCPDLLEHIFQKDFLKHFLSRDYNWLDHLQLLLLYQAATTLCPSYLGTLPPQNVLEMVITRNGDHVREFPLKAALEQGLGGESYVWTKLQTKCGHFIDHLVVMRKGGYPMALNQIIRKPKTYVEDLVVPSDSQIILVLCMPASCYAVNCQRLRAIPSLTVRTLESLGHLVVPVSLEHWMNLPDYEKIPYLMQNIKNKCESLENNEVRIVH